MVTEPYNLSMKVCTCHLCGRDTDFGDTCLYCLAQLTLEIAALNEEYDRFRKNLKAGRKYQLVD